MNGAVPGDAPSAALFEAEAPFPSLAGTQQMQCVAGGCGQQRSCSAPRARRAVSAAVALQLCAEAEPPVGRAAKHDDQRCTCGAPSPPAARCIARGGARKTETGAPHAGNDASSVKRGKARAKVCMHDTHGVLLCLAGRSQSCHVTHWELSCGCGRASRVLLFPLRRGLVLLLLAPLVGAERVALRAARGVQALSAGGALRGGARVHEGPCA